MEISTNNTKLTNEIEIIVNKQKYIIKQEKDGIKISKNAHESIIIKPLTPKSIKIITKIKENEKNKKE